ncbi:ubiquitin-like-conjugating enzyme ATG10 isoform X1 [Fukomys damarensis]|uniref:ubiquitin-like-conjugating enzyme ATG10 isoform X1 n=1 Tax=Fukomys damarensis TaxID=885580 RepID=UPI00054001BD|nr:ubiquitin-like-conjugating enzyme ATG10 isoform X1 [Fukomys damarensis]
MEAFSPDVLGCHTCYFLPAFLLGALLPVCWCGGLGSAGLRPPFSSFFFGLDTFCCTSSDPPILCTAVSSCLLWSPANDLFYFWYCTHQFQNFHWLLSSLSLPTAFRFTSDQTELRVKYPEPTRPPPSTEGCAWVGSTPEMRWGLVTVGVTRKGPSPSPPLPLTRYFLSALLCPAFCQAALPWSQRLWLNLQKHPLHLSGECQEHPILGQPFFVLHPCKTTEFMAPVLKNSQEINRTINYITSWLSVVGPAVGLNVPLSYAKATSGHAGDAD